MSRPSKDSGSAPLGVNDLIRLAHLDFGIFAVVMFPELHDGKQMVPAPYLNLMAEALMAVRDGAERRRAGRGLDRPRYPRDVSRSPVFRQ